MENEKKIADDMKELTVEEVEGVSGGVTTIQSDGEEVDFFNLAQNSNDKEKLANLSGVWNKAETVPANSVLTKEERLTRK